MYKAKVKVCLRYLGRYYDPKTDDVEASKLLAFEDEEPYWLPTVMVDPSKMFGA